MLRKQQYQGLRTNTSQSDKQEGGTVERTCYNCVDLETIIGFCELHHKCKKGMFGGVSTPHHYYPTTPDNCIYLNIIKL